MTTLLSCKTSENAVEMVILEYSALQIGIINMGMLLVKNPMYCEWMKQTTDDSVKTDTLSLSLLTWKRPSIIIRQWFFFARLRNVR